MESYGWTTGKENPYLELDYLLVEPMMVENDIVSLMM